MPGGRHAIEGDMMYANVDDVETKLFETTKPESHRNYVDIQFMVDGEEYCIVPFWTMDWPSSTASFG